MSQSYFFLIKQLRLERGYSQEQMAEKLDISRSSYVAFEQGIRELTLREAALLSEKLHISLEDIRVGKIIEPEPIPEKKFRKFIINKEEKKVEEDRISVPREHEDKFKQVLLYLISRIGGKPNIGMTVLYKMLYFIDFDYYEKFEEQLIGARYMKNTYGPTPIIFAKILKELEMEGKLETIKSKFYTHDQTKYLVNPDNSMDLSTLSSRELSHIDWEITRLSDLTATQISGLSHKDTPWLVAKDKDILEYEHVFYRPEETSVRVYESL